MSRLPLAFERVKKKRGKERKNERKKEMPGVGRPLWYFVSMMEKVMLTFFMPVFNQQEQYASQF